MLCPALLSRPKLPPNTIRPRVQLDSSRSKLSSGQPLSPMTSPAGPSLGGDHATHIKEEDQERLNIGNSSMPRCSSPPHRHGSRPHRPHAMNSFCLVQDPAAY